MSFDSDTLSSLLDFFQESNAIEGYDYYIALYQRYDLKTLNDITEKSTRRYTLFKWTATDDEWGLKTIESKDIDNKNLDELKDFISSQINQSKL